MKNNLLVLCLIFSFFSCRKNEVTSVVLSEQEKVLSIGETLQLKAQVTATKDASEFWLSWSSEDESVATVTSDGLVTARTPGDTYVTASAGGVEARCRIGVKYFVKAGRTFMREPYSTGKSDLFTLCLATGGVDLTSLEGKGEYLSIEFFVPVGTKDSLPQGVYEMVTDFNPPAGKGRDEEYEKFLPYTLSPGFVMETEQWGTWHTSLWQGTATPIQAGMVEVGRSADGLYIVRYDLKDEQGNSLFGVYEGDIE